MNEDIVKYISTSKAVYRVVFDLLSVVITDDYTDERICTMAYSNAAEMLVRAVIQAGNE